MRSACFAFLSTAVLAAGARAGDVSIDLKGFEGTNWFPAKGNVISVALRPVGAAATEPPEVMFFISKGGVTRSKPVPAGSYRLTAESLAHDGLDAIVEATIEIEGAAQTVVVELPALTAVRLEVEPKRVGQVAIYEAKAGIAESHPTSKHIALLVQVEAGGAEVELPAGDYRFRFVDDDGWLANVSSTIPAKDPILLRPRLADALAVVIEDSKGLLAAGGLRDGDEIVKIEGVAVAGEDSKRLLAGALVIARKKQRVTVLREGAESEFDLEIEPLKAGDDVARLGGYFEIALRSK